MARLRELRQKSKSELEKLLKDRREKLQHLRFDLSMGKLKNVKEVRKIKKDIARILTFLQILNRGELTNKKKQS